MNETTTQMDERDIEILQAVAESGTGSPETIQERTGIPKSTVHYRINRLKEKGVVKNDLFDLDLEKLGLRITVITEVLATFHEGYHETVGEKLGDITGVNHVYFTMGDTDFVVIARLTDREMVEQLVERYESIEEVERTSSKFVITTVKDQQNPVLDYDIETLLGTGAALDTE